MKWKAIPSLLAAVFFFHNDAQAKFAQPTLAPIPALLEKAQAFLRQHPEDAQSHYVLGRIHYLAFYNRALEAAVFSAGQVEGLPAVAPYWTAEQSFLYQSRNSEATSRVLEKFSAKSVSDLPPEKYDDYSRELRALTEELEKSGWRPPGIEAEQVLAHAEAAYLSFEKAIAIEPDNALYLLGKASLLEQFHDFSKKENPETVTPGLKGITTEIIRKAHLAAYTAGTMELDDLKSIPVAGLRSVASYEAAAAYVRLCENGKLTDHESTRLLELRSKLEELKKLRRGAITPIVFSLRKIATLGSLIDTAAKVSFDLDGDGLEEEWPWVKAETAFLVWDPARSGRILSGRQFFGSYTFEIPWENGYQPLAMLDRNDNGELSEGELDGIRAWFDRNGNGVSESGEVVDPARLGIESISAFPSSGTLFNARGIRLKSGGTLATWDWIPERAQYLSGVF